MNIFSYVLMLISVLIIVLGLIIWKKQKVSLIRGYNSNKNIKKEDVRGYTESIGKAYILIGIATLTTIMHRLTDNDIYDFIIFIVWIAGTVISIVKIIKTQKKYGTGIWS